MLRFAVPILVMVTLRVATCGVGVKHTAKKSMEAGDTEMPGAGAADPVPLTLTVTGFSSGSFDGISKLSVYATAAVGENRTVSVQLPPSAIVWFEQLSVSLPNGAASVSALAMAPITRSAVPSLVIVTVSSDKRPTLTVPNGT